MFYQFPNSNLFTQRLLFFSREATSETYGPGSLSHIICLWDLFYLLSFSDLLIQKYKNTLLCFILIYFICRSIYQSTTIYLTSACLSWGAVPRKGLTTPLTRRVARCCCLCAGAVYVVLLGSPTGSIPWFHNWGKYLPSLCYIIPPSPGKYWRSFSCHQGEFLASLPGRIKSR